MSARSFAPRPIEAVAAELGRLDRLMEAAAGRAGMAGRLLLRWLGRRYQLVLLQAAEMLDVAIPPESEWQTHEYWGSLYIRGSIYDGRTEFLIEEALRAAGFDPFTRKEV